MYESIEQINTAIAGICERFDNGTMDSNDNAIAKALYKTVFKEVSALFPNNPSKQYKQDKFASFERCGDCKRYCINQLRNFANL